MAVIHWCIFPCVLVQMLPHNMYTCRTDCMANRVMKGYHTYRHLYFCDTWSFLSVGTWQVLLLSMQHHQVNVKFQIHALHLVAELKWQYTRGYLRPTCWKRLTISVAKQQKKKCAVFIVIKGYSRSLLDLYILYTLCTG